MRRTACVCLLSFLGAGCAANSNLTRMQRENAELKEKVVRLELQVAELRSQKTPISINGITLTGPEVGDIRWAPKPSKPAESSGMFTAVGTGRLILAGGTNATVNVTNSVPWRGEVVGTIDTREIVKQAGHANAATTAATTPTPATTNASTTPSHAK